MPDVVVLGAGHNGLVAAVLLARAGLDVTVVEEKATVGGACKTERPFPKAPNLATSTGAYLLGLMPPELIAKLGVDLPTLRRDPHYFLPDDGRRATCSSARTAPRCGGSFSRFFSERDWKRQRGAPARDRRPPRRRRARRGSRSRSSIEETAERYVRPALREVFVDLCRKLDRRLPGALRLPERPAPRDVRRDRRLLRPARHLEHAGDRDELPRPQHVPPARLATGRS